MTTEPSSPRRRHILSSINPEGSRASPQLEPVSSEATLPSDSTPEVVEPLPAETTDRTERKSSRFRFKSKSSRSHGSSRHRDRDYSQDDVENREGRSSRREHEYSSHGENRERRRHHHRRRRRCTRSRSPTPPNPFEEPPLDPEAAFRESLFDAMADDEGAAYWEGVYGQPVHVYSNAKTGPQGELEQMDDEEYAAYVRQKMWEKTHQGLLEERAKREEMRKAKDAKEQEARRLTKQMEDSLRRGEERRKKKSWKSKFEDYVAAWGNWSGTLDGMCWPIASGDRQDLNNENVRDFLVNGLDPIEIGEKAFIARLKDERVRWHPDKIQQRLGDKFDDSVRRDVTAVFQIIDKIWSDARSKS
ncbi:hypothetical protein BX600DRAFT_455859 [Xylariales sp. PMI_506]|nr:hypothetical protein BX600DRAFT_455859 [Xylariales sp. PMI_506]